MDKKVSLVDFAGSSKQKALLEEALREMETSIEFYKLRAKLIKAAYDAYIAEGFTADQALSLCKEL